jgi:hypothetical protein
VVLSAIEWRLRINGVVSVARAKVIVFSYR